MQRILPALGLLCFSIASQGAIYKWVDENGVTQFSQFPPAQQEAEQVQDTAPPPSEDPALAQERLERQIEAFEQRRETEALEREEQAAEQEHQALRRQNCATARRNLEVLQQGGRLRLRGESGEFFYPTEEQLRERIENARRAVEENCE